MTELRKLKATRAQIKGQVTRINTFLSSTQNITYEQAQARMKKLQELWITFNDNQMQIKITRAKDDEQLEQITHEEEGERIVFEQCFYKALDNVRSIIAATRIPLNIPQVEHEDRANGQPGNIDVKLPTLKLPNFAGEYDQWTLFKDAFLSLIHDNRKLSAIQKFQYLRSVLKDKALQVVSGLNTSAENYLIAWDLLKSHYENKKLIINSHVSCLLEFPSVIRDKHVSLKQFIMHLRTHLKALQVLGQPVEKWDTVIIFMARNKLDYHSQRGWEEEGQQGSEYMPTVEEFLKFLNERCRTLEMLDNSKEKSETIETIPKGNVKKNGKRVTLAATSQVYSKCKESQCLFNCSDFLKLPIQDRLAEAKRQQLCINCLKAGHYPKNCKSSKCRKCLKTHNTLLHIERADSSSKESQNSLQKNSEESEKSISLHCTKKRELIQTRRNEIEIKEDYVNQKVASQVNIVHCTSIRI